MKVANILDAKGTSLKTIKPSETVGSLSRELQQHRIGVMVVSHDGQTIDGIVSERDIAYSLAERRGELHLLPVSALMTRKVITCAPDDSLSEAARLMQRHNIRHLPVVDEGRTVGLISIGDVLAFRMGKVVRQSNRVGSWLAGSECD
jgi:CBS domain-containing protein